MNKPRAVRRDVNGILLLDKPLGLTSQQAVSKVKWLFSARKAGHTGTLDPRASGLLPIGLGEATKFSQFLLDAEKGYLASLRLGATTNTGDAEGEILQQRPVSVTVDDIARVLPQFIGAQTQTPPMHSALKVAGKPLYSFARAGITIERQPRSIVINKIQVIDYKENILDIQVKCSKGTYIRVLAEDIGEALGCGAHLAALTREIAGGFTLCQAVSFEALEALPLADRMAQLLPVDAFATSLDRMSLDPEQARRITTGLAVPQTGVVDGSYRLYGVGEVFLGVGTVEDGVLKARRLTSQLPGIEQMENCLSNPEVTG
ncbi:MAG: tRNA pseudouridine(55) synthase TruB [Burkholderiales bacterium]